MNSVHYLIRIRGHSHPSSCFSAPCHNQAKSHETVFDKCFLLHWFASFVLILFYHSFSHKYYQKHFAAMLYPSCHLFLQLFVKCVLSFIIFFFMLYLHKKNSFIQASHVLRWMYYILKFLKSIYGLQLICRQECNVCAPLVRNDLFSRAELLTFLFYPGPSTFSYHLGARTKFFSSWNASNFKISVCMNNFTARSHLQPFVHFVQEHKHHILVLFFASLEDCC